MRKFGGFLWIIFLFMVFVPGYAIGALSFTFEHPASVVVGQSFDVKIDISADAGDAAGGICTWQYSFQFDPAILQLVHATDALFFTDSPVGASFNCTVADCGNPAPLGIFAGADISLAGLSTPLSRATATLRMRALQAGTVAFSINPAATGPSGIGACNQTAQPGIVTISKVNNPEIYVGAHAVPSLSTFGMLIFSLLLIASTCLCMRRRHNRG